MVNKSKVKLMTKLAIYEKNHQDDIRLSRYYKSDYVRLGLIKNVLSVTAAYILILAMVGLYNMEWLIANAVTMDYKSLGIKVLGYYLIILIVFCMAGMFVSALHYSHSFKRLQKYFKRLKMLKKYYDETEKKHNADE